RIWLYSRPTIGEATIIAIVRGSSTTLDSVAVNRISSWVNTGNRNIEPMSIANTMPAISVPDANVGSRNIRRSMTGAVAVSSRITNATRPTAATYLPITMVVESNQS